MARWTEFLHNTKRNDTSGLCRALSPARNNLPIPAAARRLPCHPPERPDYSLFPAPPPESASPLLSTLYPGLFSFMAPVTAFYWGTVHIYCLAPALKCELHKGGELPVLQVTVILGGCDSPWDTGTLNETTGELPPLPMPQPSCL